MSTAIEELIPEGAGELEVVEVGEGLVDRPNPLVELRRWGSPFEPLPFQRELIEGIDALARRGPACGLLCLPTGAGKTLTAARIALDRLRASDREVPVALWIAPQRELLFQASDAAQAAWWSGNGPPSLDVRVVEKRSQFSSPSRATVLLATPAMSGKFIDTVSGRLSVAIFDEAHHAAASTFGTTWARASRPGSGIPSLALGLSATPDRTNSEERRVLQEAFGRQLYVPRSLGGNPAEALLRMGVSATAKFCRIEGVPAFSRRKGLEDRRTLRSLAGDADRWNATIGCLTREERGQTIVYALDRRHGHALTRHLRWMGEAAEYLDGRSPLSTRIAVFERFRDKATRVLVNVGLLLEGVDCPAADSIVLTHPVGSRLRLQQMIGRVLRGPAVGGTTECRVWSIEGDQDWLDRVRGAFDPWLAGWKVVTLDSSSSSSG